MFILEESQLLEDKIVDKGVLELYKNLRQHESESSLDWLLISLDDEKFKQVCRLLELSSIDRSTVLDRLNLSKDDAAALILIVSATLAHFFIVDNFTGPIVSNVDKLIADKEPYIQLKGKYDFQSLTTDGCEVYHKISNPWILKTAQLCWDLLSNLGVSRRLLELEFLVSKHRLITAHLTILLESPESLLKELKKIQEYIFDHHIINDLRENKTQLVRYNKVELCCELAQSAIIRDGITSSRKILDYASELSGVYIEHTGVLGRRTKFQQNDIPQLVVKVTAGSQEPTDLQQAVEPFEPDSADLPKSIQLDDDTLLPEISFVTDGGETTRQELSPDAQLLMLAKLDYILRTEVMEESLKDEWTLAYLRSIIESATIWTVKYKSLALRSRVEKKQMRKMDRSLLQLEELLTEVEGAKCQDNRRSIRMKSFYAVLPLSRWQTQRLLGDISFDLGLFKNALEVYLRLEYWEGIIKCYSALGETSKAEAVIRQELGKQETPYLYCLLGDATDDLQYYEKSWQLSKGRFARAKKSIGTHHYTRKNYSEAIENYEEALRASPSNISILSLLAYCYLLCENYEKAAECYRNLTYQDDSNFLAWNNLSKAYIKLDQKPRAWRTLREAIKCNYEEPKIWENFMLVSVQIGALDDVISSWHQLIRIKGSHKDDQILSALTYLLIKKSYNEPGADVPKLIDSAVELACRISTTAASSARVWLCYLRLLIRQFELLQSTGGEKESNQSMELITRVGKIKKCLQRATPTALLSDANWHKCPDKIDSVLGTYDELIDCYDLTLCTIGQRAEIISQWAYFKMSLKNTLETLRRRIQPNS